ncbi:MAG TPA: FG-GAP-like repeat-containing protein [Candidatus Polarisedimenticolia bacterium]|nr:FG-GAP-like repeat-containing protein [Candidatus Polarisedimenticolia bacterium]
MVARRLFFGLLLGASCCPVAWGAALFPDPVFHSDDQTRDVATGDFNGDSIPDVVTVSPSSRVLTLLPGVGDGTFLPKSTIPTSLPLTRVLAADLNGDGRTDIIGLQITDRFSAPSSNPSHVVTRLGNGDGTFGNETSILVTNYWWALGMTLGDLNGDGVVDLVVTTYDYSGPGNGYYHVLAGRGDGTFSPPLTYAPGATSVAIGDFNRDGHADLAGASNGSTLVSITPGLGGFAFGSWSYFSAGNARHDDIKTADVDNDGDLDLVTSGRSLGNSLGEVHVLLGNGGGGFVLTGTYNCTTDAQRLSVVDLNGDGVVDLAAVGRGKLVTFPGFGPGVFGQSVEYGVGHDYGIAGAPETLAIADLNGDGAQDVVVADAFGGVIPFLNLIGVGQGLGQPRFGSTKGGGRLATGDFNEDGQVDLAVTDRFHNQVAILLGDPHDFFPVETRFAAGSFADAVAVGDFNADQHQDLAITDRVPNGTSSITILLGQGNGSFVPGTTLAGGEKLAAIVVGDFNGDGVQDLAAANSGNSNLLVYLGQGNGAFGPFSRYNTDEGPVDLAVTDLDGDGIQDLVATARGINGGFQDKVALLRGAGNGTFAPTFIPMGGDLTSVRVADFNGDSIPDLAVADVQASQVWVLIGLGGGLFAPRTAYSAPGAASLAVADFDGDQVPDLAALSLSDRRVSVLRGTGSGTFGPAEPFTTAGDFAFGPYDLVVSDINRDGRPDLALSSDLALTTLLLSQAQPTTENHPPVANAGADRQAECSSPAGAAVTLDGSLSSDPDSTPGTDDDIVFFQWYENLGTPSETLLGEGVTLTVTFPLGTHSLTLLVTDSGGLTATDAQAVSVVDTTPPSLAVTLDPAVLWPPNHRMVPVTATVSASDACGAVSVSLLSVTSSEPDDAPGGADGMTTNDVQGVTAGTPDLEFLLRAERVSGGPGRTYTAVYQAQDGAQHTAQVAATAFVTHDKNGVTDPITLLVSESPTGTWLVWSAVSEALSYGVIRGDLELLRSMGQSAPSGAPACLASGLTRTDMTGFEDPASPGPGQAFFYFVEYDDGRASGFGTQSTFWDRTEAVGFPCP